MILQRKWWIKQPQNKEFKDYLVKKRAKTSTSKKIKMKAKKATRNQRLGVDYITCTTK